MSKIPCGTHIILHKTCGAPAFLYSKEPTRGTRILRKHTYNLDGSKFALGRPLSRCGSCGGILKGSADLRPGGPVLREFDMTNPEDMHEYYSCIRNAEEIA